MSRIQINIEVGTKFKAEQPYVVILFAAFLFHNRIIGFHKRLYVMLAF